jgi:hypothetical protein
MGTELLLQALFPFSHLYQRLMAQLMHVSSTGSLSGYVQRPACDISARSVVVWTLRNRPMVHSRGRRQDFWQAFHASRTDAVLDAFYNGYLRPRRSMTLM